MTIFLIGSMGVGKSAIGKRMAHLMDLPFRDTDQLVVEEDGLSINEIFEQKGEFYFRKLETKILTEIDFTISHLIATGGGLPITANNMDYMKTHGVVVYLRDKLDSITEKLFKGRHKRPAIKDLNKEEIHHKLAIMIKKRSPIYERAHLTFDRSQDRDKDAHQLSTYLKMFV